MATGLRISDHPDVVAFAPGRVNLAGEHTDYNDGLALPFAIEEGVTVSATIINRQRVQVLADDLDGSDVFPLREPPPASGWCAFARGAVAELQRAGIRLPGCRLRIAGSVPRGAGLSSSAALEVALSMALIRLAGEPAMEPLELAKLCSRVENEWVGARTGLLDQLASLFGQEGRALRIDFRSLEITPIPLALGQWRLVALDSGEHRSNAASGYNARREECARACRLLGLESLRDAAPEDAERLPAPLDRRVRHVLDCNARVEEMVAALERGDLAEVGRLLDVAHASLRDLYEVSTPALEATVARLKEDGAAGARLIGGGFGGSVLGLMPPSANVPPEAIEVRPGSGARLVEAPARSPRPSRARRSGRSPRA